MLGIIGGTEPNDVYRIQLPFHYAGLDWVDLPNAPNVPANYDVYVLSRIWTINPEADASIGDLPGRIVFDTDDDLSNPLVVTSVEDVLLAESVARIVKLADAVTVTTPYLGKLYTERFGTPYHVLPNCIDLEMWKGHTRDDPALTIGIAGGDSHQVDWRLIEEPLHKVVREFPQVRVIVAGFLPDYLDQKWVTYIPWGPYEVLPLMVRQFDIGLCPLPVNSFNLCKSAIKALEYMASERPVNGKPGGACVLASNMPVYRRVVNNKSNGLLVKDDEWYEAIKTVIEDKFLRWKLQQRGLRWVTKHRDVRKEARRWVNFYKTLTRR